MKHIHLGLSLSFDDPEVCESSEKFLMALLGHNCVVNHRYLREHPEVPLLYESGVVYAPPDQSGKASRVSSSALERVAKLLKKEGAETHKVEAVLHLLNGTEEFLDVPALYARGCGDCNELVPVRVAELWRAGIMACPLLVKHEVPGGIVYHAMVKWPDGSDEDPSLILGMGGRDRAADRAEEIRKNRERWENFLDEGKRAIAEGASPERIAQQIDLMGLIPRRKPPQRTA